MGGFHLFERVSEDQNGAQRISPEDDVPLHPLLASDLQRDDIYSFTMPTEAEIKDKGKSDWLAKSLVLLQTSWFVMQCIARAVERLPVTHLEIVTLAYAAMNFVIYVFWWDKPLNVNRPVRVFRKSGQNEPYSSGESEGRKWTVDAIGKSMQTVINFVAGFQDNAVDLSREDRVPRFWADGDGNESWIADQIVLGVGVCFGGIHCIAWHFHFPTHGGLLLWRISSIAITAVPIYMPLGFVLGALLAVLPDADTSTTEKILALILLPGGLLYILARAATLVLAFISLRGLPNGAYETVHWTTFIPHI